jgi:tetratricopeptide (TPR) repeat protein
MSAAVKALNDKLLAANQALQAGDSEAAIKSLTEANELEPNHDLIWAKLGGVYLASAPKQTDSEEKNRRYTEAAEDYQKAIDLLEKKKDPNPKAPPPNQDLAGYYNNLAHAQAKAGKLDDAIKAYNQAIQLDPSGAVQYYYNLGAILMNAGRNDEAIAAFDKSIAADPTKPDAYFQKGSSLVAKSTADSNGKISAPPGTQEALNKYLQLAPDGQFAAAAKGMIQYIGGTIETGYKQRTKKN